MGVWPCGINSSRNLIKGSVIDKSLYESEDENEGACAHTPWILLFMNRRELLRVCAILGIGLPFSGCASEDAPRSTGLTDSNPSGPILIIGAGAAGLSAAYLLKQHGRECIVLEASDQHGGRIKRAREFADFPIPLGAEWLHSTRSELSRIVNDPNKKIRVNLQGYDREDVVGYFDGRAVSYTSLRDEFGSGYIDKKFVNSSWFDFFDEYIVPRIQDSIRYQTAVTSVDYHGEKIVVTDAHGFTYEVPHVIVTVPLRMLQKKRIDFIPDLPQKKRNALEKAPVWDGLKMFLKFSERFYPTFLTFADSETSAGQRMYYDAAYGHNTSEHVLGLFAVGAQAEAYRHQAHEEQLAYVLKELDEIFEGRASQAFQGHVAHDWIAEPFIESAYLADNAPSYISRDLFTPIQNKVFFAGEAYTAEDDWGGVHNATTSARDVVERILRRP